MKIVRSVILLVMMAMMAACGSSGGKDDAPATTTTTPTVILSYNLTGTVVGENGITLPGVTIYIFKPSYTTVTDSSGKYSQNVTSGKDSTGKGIEHLIMTSKPGTKEVFKVVDMSSGNAVNQPLMAYNSAVSPVNVVAHKPLLNPSDPDAQWTKITSNAIGEKTAVLKIPPQPSGNFTINGESKSNADISVEYLDVSQPLPVPLPSPATLNSGDVKIDGKQAPSVMVSISPALLTLENGYNAQLFLPNPDKLSGKRILRFDPELHKWIDTGKTASDDPNAFVPVIQGGIYGIFFEDRRTSTVRGTAPAGSVVFAGDEIITVSSDGTFTATVAMPENENGTLNMLNWTPSTSTITTGSVSFKDKPSDALKPDQVKTVTFTTPTQDTVSSVTVKAGTDSLVADGFSSTAITATVLSSGASDGSSGGKPVADGTVVTFNSSLGTLSAQSAKTKGGVATVTLSSVLNQSGTATITATAGGVSGTTTIKFLDNPQSISLSLTKQDGSFGYSVKSDGSDYLNVTATVLNSKNAPFADIDVSFSIQKDDGSSAVDGGKLTATGTATDPSLVRTGTDGKATIRFSANPANKANQTVYIAANVGKKLDRKPIQITGTTLTLTNDKTNLDKDGKNKAILVISLKDAGGNPIPDQKITATVKPGNSGDKLAGKASVSLMSFIEDPAKCQTVYSGKCKTDVDGVLSGDDVKTDVKGELRIQVSGKQPTSGQATVEIEALGDSKTQIYTVNSPEETFAISTPATRPASHLTNEEPLEIVVNASKLDKVRFSTSFGTWWDKVGNTWVDSKNQVIDVPVNQTTGTARAYLHSNNSGIANVQVFYIENQTIKYSDGIQVAIAAPTSEASQISIQASNTVVPPKVGTVESSVTLTAAVKNANNQVVRNVPVAFSLSNTTGGGEYVTPVIAYTNELGIAETKFYSGQLSSKAEGVKITAVALTGPAPCYKNNNKVIGICGSSADGDTYNVPICFDDKMRVDTCGSAGYTTPIQHPFSQTNIVIGGTATSIIIGIAHKMESVQNNTAYSQPMSVQVVDSKGNPVSNVKVTLGIWPTRYRTGYWTRTPPCKPVILGIYDNEDSNRNLILDSGEDADPNKDGKITPPSSAAGSLPSSTTTDSNITTTESDASGVGNFTLTYLKNSAVWIEAEITATTVVLGTESKSVYTVWLPYIEDEACNLPDSPYNPATISSGEVRINANPKLLLANGKTPSEVSAFVKDTSGAPIDQAVVIFEITSGEGGFPSLKTITAKTDASGVAKVTYTSPQKVTGTTVITATAIDPTSKKEIYLKGDPVSITLGTGSLEIIASKNELTADGVSTSTITVTALDPTGAMVQSAEPIAFTLTGSGSISSAIVNTASGVANIVYTASKTPGTVTIKAEMTSSGAPPVSINLNLVLKPVGFISLAAAPTSINADGVSSLQITATLTDSSGNPVPAGTSVTFTIGSEPYDTELPDEGKFPNRQRTYTVSTIDATGKAVVSLISGLKANPSVVVRCSYTGTAGTVSQTTTVAFTGSGVSDPTAKPGYIEAAPLRDTSGNSLCYNTSGQSGTCNSTYTIPILYPQPRNISVRGTQGTSASTFKFVLYDTAGKAMTKKTRIDFQILAGPNGGEILLTPFAYTDSSGQVETIVRAGSKPGSVTVKAYCFADSSINTSSSQLVIGGGFPVGEAFDIAAQYLNISGLSISGLKDVISVNLADAYGNSVSDGTTIAFKTYNTGGSLTPATATTSSTSPGTAISSLVSGVPNPEHGFVSVTAEVLNGDRSTHITSLAVARETELSQILYAGTNGGGVYKSVNSGLTWTNISRSTTIAGQNRIEPYVNDIVVDPYNKNVIYAATGYLGRGNIYRSLDGGLNWNSNNPSEWAGIFGINAAVTTLLCGDAGDSSSSPIMWAGTAGQGLYAFVWATDTVSGAQVLSPKYWEKSLFSYVNDIVRVSNTAVLYTGTSVGVYKSTDSGATWKSSDSSPFGGYYVTKLLLHPNSNGGNNDVIYAGTRDSGVWVSIDSGKSWTQFAEGIGKGVFATYPLASTLNLGDGSMSEVKVYSGAKSENWTVAHRSGVFTVTGTVSGKLSQTCSAGQKCTIPNVMEFTITAGEKVAFKEGDAFTFKTISDDGRYIKSMEIDAKNGKLYALTYFKSDLAPHTIGTAYVHDLNSDGSMAYRNWREVTTGLASYDPPNDTSLAANHVIVSDDPTGLSPTKLYLGGEGIDFYTASLSSGEPALWVQNNTGLSNLIMARMQILFSGQAYVQQIDIGGSSYITAVDINGNPPVGGSKFDTYVQGTTTIVKTYSYADTQYNQLFPVQSNWKVTFTPTCTLTTTSPYYTLPGCSGGSSYTCDIGSCPTP